MNKSMVIMIAIAVAVLAVVAAGIFLKRRPRKIKVSRIQDKWREMQKLCSAKETWPDAIVAADRLLDDVLKKRKFGGKSMGERLTKAQRVLSDNESVWFGHKLRTKLEGDPDTKLKETDVKQALVGIRQALKDLGALPDGK
jgi:hypothetical protein